MFMSSGGAGGRHYLYREDDLVQNRTCGVPGPSEHRASSIAAHQAARVSQLVTCAGCMTGPLAYRLGGVAYEHQ